MQLPVTLPLHPSRQLATLLLVAHAGAVSVLVVVSPPVWIGLIFLPAIVWYAWRTRRRTHGSARIAHLVLRADGRLEYIRVNGESGEALIHPHTTVMPQLTVLLLRMGRRIESLVLLPDSLSAENFRLLRLWLRWQAGVNKRLQ
ncbi:MAG: protein YgfX [Sterolibacterium sp.]